MANDRLLLVCKHCGDATLLFKYYPTLARYAGTGLSEFVQEHMLHHPHAGAFDLRGSPGFVIIAESTEDPEETKILERSMEIHDKRREAEDRG